MKQPNASKRGNETYVRVMCPKCGNGGAHPTSMHQPRCHICNYEVLMEPANNTEIVCSWKDVANL